MSQVSTTALAEDLVSDLRHIWPLRILRIGPDPHRSRDRVVERRPAALRGALVGCVVELGGAGRTGKVAVRGEEPGQGAAVGSFGAAIEGVEEDWEVCWRCCLACGL